MADKFRCTLVTPQEQVLDQEVVYASIPAWDGQLGVAPQRAALVAKLGDGLLRLDLGPNQSRHFFLAGGFAQMLDNHLTLLTEEAVPAEAVNVAEVEAARHAAENRLARTPEEVVKRQREINRARTLLHLAQQR